MEFIDEKIEDYAEQHTSAESELLQEINRDTWAKVMMPRMLSGHMQGRFLSMISKMVQPHAILEIGTYTGYSALCLAEGLAEGGILHTIDNNEELEDRVRDYFKRSDFDDNITFHVGNALEVIPNIQAQFDLVFIDADKNNYSNYYDLIFDRLRPGGYIIADNVLWSGKVLDEKEKAKDLDTRSLAEFNEKIMADNRVENILVPIRDGLMVVRKR